MCAPVIAAPLFYASLAVSAATAVVGYVSQKNMAEAQYEAAEANNEALRQASISNMVQQTSDTNAREREERASTALNIQNQRLAAQRAKSTARATSESAGLSMEMLYEDFDRQYLNYADAQMQQLGFNLDQIQRTREGIEAQTKSRINSGWDNRPITQPNLLGTALEFGGSALSAYNNYSHRDPFTGERTLY